MCETRDLLKRLEEFLRETLRNCTNDWEYDSANDSELQVLDNILSQIVKHPNGSVSNYLSGGENITNTHGATVVPVDEPHSHINKLEMIKVIVLIVVILIILITTCRMVFQLSMRFRPEKNNLNE